MKTNAIISAIICYLLAAIVIISAIVKVSFIGFIMGGMFFYMGRNFYLSKEA